MTKVSWPAWFYGPNNQAEVFASENLVPKGWADHPSKVSDENPKPAPAAKTAPKAEETPELDANGTAWNPDLHSATKTKTTAGLWRMKVGVSRPPVLDL